MPVIRVSQIPLCHTCHFSDKEMGERGVVKRKKNYIQPVFSETLNKQWQNGSISVLQQLIKWDAMKTACKY